jgi:hypothetical protein
VLCHAGSSSACLFTPHEYYDLVTLEADGASAVDVEDARADLGEELILHGDDMGALVEIWSSDERAETERRFEVVR